MQQQQIVVSNGTHFYADLSLGATPILTTADRMHASQIYTGRGITIAFIDSGFYPHPDLLRPRNRIVAMYDAVNGRSYGSTRSLARQNPSVEQWHGTMTACVAAGSGYNSDGLYRGLASEADVVLIKAMTPQYAIQTPQVVRALRWIRRNYVRYNIRIVNMSLGVDERAQSLEHPVIALVEELVALGIVVVAASGNHPMRPVVPPGAAPSAITVGGYNDNNSSEFMRRELWTYSHGNAPGGEQKPELLAPAIWVAAPVLPRTQVKLEADTLFHLAAATDGRLMKLIPKLASRTVIGDNLLKATTPLYARSLVLRRIAEEKLITSDYKHVDGTSFAAPIVASIVAQMLEARPSLTPAEVKQLLMITATRLENVPPEIQGHGVVQADKAIEATLYLVAPAPETKKVSMWEKLPS
jgi:serine protease AprX